MTNLIDSLLEEDSTDSQDSLQPHAAKQIAEHVIAAPEKSKDEWVTLRDKSIAQLPKGSIVRGLAAKLNPRDLRAMVDQGEVVWRDWYSGTFNGVVYDYGAEPPCPGPRCCDLPRLRADEKFSNGLDRHSRWAADLRAEEKALLAEIETAIEKFDEEARKKKDRKWTEVAQRALTVRDLEAKLAAHRARIDELLTNSSNTLYNGFDTIVAGALGVSIEELGLERRPVSIEHRAGKMIFALFNGQKVEVACG